MGSQTKSNNRFIFRQHVQRIKIQKISSIEMAATKMKHILVLFVILALTKNLERKFASAKSVRNVVEEESPSISSFLEADLENKKANLQVEDRGCSKNGGGCFFSTAKCCTGVCLAFFCAGNKNNAGQKYRNMARNEQ